MADSSHMFIFGVFVFYGFLFMMYSLSGGAIVGLSDSSYLINAPATGGIVDAIVGTFDIILSFFATLLVNPYSALVYLIPFNWALIGTSVYLFIRILRGGG